MKCAYHADTDAVAGCVACGNLICKDCDVLVGGRHFCRKCLAESGESKAPRPPGAGAGSGKRLTRSTTDRWLAGVCGGMAVYMSMDPTLVRLLAILVGFATGILPMLIAYVVAACVIPEETGTPG
jgi:phage shock protein C